MEDFESLSSSMGLTFDWTLPSEPSLRQIVAREPSFHVIPTQFSRSRSQDCSPNLQPEQSLAELPVERDTIGQSIIGLRLPLNLIQEFPSGLWCSHITHLESHWWASARSFSIVRTVPVGCDKLYLTIISIPYAICKCILWWVLPAYAGCSHSDVQVRWLQSRNGFGHGGTGGSIPAWASKRCCIILCCKSNTPGKETRKWKTSD